MDTLDRAPLDKYAFIPGLKRVKIVGKNYFGSYSKTRTACRGVVADGGLVLMSYEEATGQWMLPGGGLEAGETPGECCRREVAEETGYLVEPTECVLEVTDYFRDLKHVNHYYLASVTGRTEQHLTEREEKAQMGPEWIPVEEAIEIFSQLGEDASPLRRALYRREYAALTALFGEKSK